MYVCIDQEMKAHSGNIPEVHGPYKVPLPPTVTFQVLFFLFFFLLRVSYSGSGGDGVGGCGAVLVQ